MFAVVLPNAASKAVASTAAACLDFISSVKYTAQMYAIGSYRQFTQ